MQIAFNAQTNFLLSHNGFAASRSAMRASAFLHYGMCSSAYAQVENAWHAVGVGSKSSCVISSLEPVSINQTTTVFPNPTQLQISVQVQNVQHPHYAMYSVNGSAVISGKLTEGTSQLDISSVPSGVYFLHISGDQYNEVHRVIKSD